MSMDNVQDVYPLSPMQEGMLFHSLKAPGSGVFVEQLHTQLRGDFQIERFQQAWSVVISNHDALRTSILWDGLDEPLQVVNRAADLPWTIFDWSQRNPQSQEHAFAELLSRDRAKGFDLVDAPAMRMHLIRTAPQEWTWLWSFHHILLDGWSGALLRDELLSTYKKLTEGKELQPAAVPSFREYIAWLRGQNGSEAASFWRSYFKGFHNPSRLAPDADSPKGSDSYIQHQATLSERRSARLLAAAQSAKVTSNTMVQAAWALTLAKYSNQQDVCFGVTLSGRSAQFPNIEQTVGMFIATLPLRTRIDLGMPLEGWLQGIQASHSTTRDYEHCSLASIQKWAGQVHEPLFDSLLVFENYPAENSTSLNDIGLEVAEFEHIEQSNYPIALLVVPGPKLRLILIRDSARISQRFARDLLDCFRQLLVTLTDQTHDVADCVDEPSLGQALLGESDTATFRLLDSDCGSDAPKVLSWIAEQVVLKPNELAVEFQGNRLSYRELELWSNRIANQLISSDVKPSEFVGLCLQPSLEMIAAILGVMKAGAAYVPLDPAYPQEIVTSIAEDAKLAVVLSHKAVSCDLFRGGSSEFVSCADASVSVIDVESLLKSSNSSSEPPKVAVKETDYAYMIYTSGSTGTPKGVPVTHRNLDYSTSARKEFYGTPPEKFLLMSSVSFDSSIAGLFWTLASGGTLVLTSQTQRTDANSLANLIAETQITHTLMLPSLYELLLENADKRSLDSLQFVIVAGETCSSRLGKKHFRKAPSSRLFNEYGPTEATVWSSVQELTRSNSRQDVPIGRSIRGTELFVTDALGRLVPAGDRGEICVAGPGVVEGYWQRPSLSKSRFFSRKTSDGQRRRVYRTGDIGFVSSSGELMFCGRNDHQVKVRGHRVELPALESLILECEGVAQAKVTSSNQGLIAHVVGASELEETLRTRIANSLPEYMAPTKYHFWSEFPRLPNGKVDHRKLAESKALVSGSVQGPRTETERLLHDIWCEVLELDSVGVHDDFFSVGGDSLSSMRVLSMARNAGLVLGSPAQLVETSTIASLAEKLGVPYSEVLVRFNSAQTKEVLVLLAAGGVDATYYRHLAAHFPDVTVVGLQSRGLNGSQPHKRIEDIASDCIAALKNSVGGDKEFHLVGRCVACPVSLEVATQLEEMETPAHSLTILDSGLRWMKQTVDYQYYYRRFNNPLLSWAALTKYLIRKRYRRYRRKVSLLLERAFATDWREKSFRRHVQAVSMRAQDEYHPSGTGTAITLIRSSEYSEASKKDFHIQQWQSVALGGISYTTVNGIHDMMLKEPMVSEVADRVRQHLGVKDASHQQDATSTEASG